jgi:hypothetical protein
MLHNAARYPRSRLGKPTKEAIFSDNIIDYIVGLVLAQPKRIVCVFEKAVSDVQTLDAKFISVKLWKSLRKSTLINRQCSPEFVRLKLL